MKRIKLIPATGINSSYKKRRNPNQRLDIGKFNSKGQRGNFICPDMFESLKKLDLAVKEKQGNLYIIDLFRSWDTQAHARTAYEQGKKRAYVAKPGGSFHTSGRAVDISVKELNFEGECKDDWLQIFWDLAIPLGFRPIIKIPDLSISENWHYDHPGKDWQEAYDKLSYSEIAKCCILDVGEWNSVVSQKKVLNMYIQAQLIRLGHYEIGKVDGYIGSKTLIALEKLNLTSLKNESIAERLTNY